MTNLPTSEVLNRAADLIEERGWRRGSGWICWNTPAAESICLEGGIMAALGLVEQEDDEEDLVYKELRACPAYQAVSNHLALGSDPLYYWNDDQDDMAPVIEVLRACAVIEASREREAAEVSA